MEGFLAPERVGSDPGHVGVIEIDTVGEFRWHSGAALVTEAALMTTWPHPRGWSRLSTARTEFASSIEIEQEPGGSG
jgi:hypothetical protein